MVNYASFRGEQIYVDIYSEVYFSLENRIQNIIFLCRYCDLYQLNIALEFFQPKFSCFFGSLFKHFENYKDHKKSLNKLTIKRPYCTQL